MPNASLPHLGVHLLGKNPQTKLNTNARPREHVHAYAIPARHWDLGTLVGNGHVGRSGIHSTLIRNSWNCLAEADEPSPSKKSVLVRYIAIGTRVDIEGLLAYIENRVGRLKFIHSFDGEPRSR